MTPSLRGGIQMADLTPEEVRSLARVAGIDLDDARAEAVAARLGRLLEELDRVPEDLLADLEPVTRLVVEPGVDNE